MRDDRDAARLYRLAQANKLIRLGLIRRNKHGELVPTSAMDNMDDVPIVPDEIDFRETRRRRVAQRRPHVVRLRGWRP